MLFGSTDAANAITVDKTPAALWVMDVSVRLFGLNPWSVLAPQALEGVAAVALLFAAVRRAAGVWAALLAGAVLALTPVCALIFRFNNPDALLLVLLLVASAYCVQRASEPNAPRWWPVAAGVGVGFGFLAKMLQALLVLPAFAAAYLITADRPLRRRMSDVFVAAAAVVASAGWYLLLVELWPASARPYVGGSQHNSIVELALGYNGFGRLTGNEPGGLGNVNFDVGPGRLVSASMGSHIAWLLPVAVICLGAGVVLTRRRPRTDPARTALILWGGWLVVTAAVFSFARGIVHPYYTVALAPAIAALIGIGAELLWQRRASLTAAATLGTVMLVTALMAVVLLGRNPDWLPWLRPAVGIGGVAASASLLVSRRLGATAARVVAACAMIVGLAAPAACSIATAASPHDGGLPSVSPAAHGVPPGFPWAIRTRRSARIGRSARPARSRRAAGSVAMVPAPRGPSAGDGEAAGIRAWVQQRFVPQTIDGVVVYDLMSTPRE